MIESIWAFLCTRAGTTMVQVGLAMLLGVILGLCVAERVKGGWR